MHFISAPLEGSGLCKQHTARQLTRFWNTWSYYRPSCISLQQSFLDLASIHLRDPLKGRPETEVFVDAHTLLLWRMALRDRVWDENEETGVALLPWEGGLRFFWREMSLSGRDIRATTISVDQTRASAAKQLIRGCATKKKKEKAPSATPLPRIGTSGGRMCQIVERSWRKARPLHPATLTALSSKCTSTVSIIFFTTISSQLHH